MLLPLFSLFFVSWFDEVLSSPEPHDFGLFDIHNYVEPFEQFLKEFGKTYSDPAEKARRLALFAANNRFIKDLAAKMPNTQFGITKFTDWTDEEMDGIGMELEMMDGHNRTGEQSSRSERSTETTETRETTEKPQQNDTKANVIFVDWRTKDVVSSIKEQGICSSSWTFAAVAATESALVISGRENTPGDYSEQGIVDCVTESTGCQGGYPWDAFQYISKHGLEEEVDYPYEDNNVTLECRGKENQRRIDSVHAFEPFDVKGMEEFLEENGPITMIMYIEKSLFFYKGGVYHPESCTHDHTTKSHAMASIGHGIENGAPYWLLKNSWGSKWGDEGYIKVFKGGNTCDIEHWEANAPVIKKKKSRN